MSLNKRIKGDFSIENVDGVDQLTLKSDAITIEGLAGLPAGSNVVTLNGQVVAGSGEIFLTTSVKIKNDGGTIKFLDSGGAYIPVDLGTGLSSTTVIDGGTY